MKVLLISSPEDLEYSVAMREVLAEAGHDVVRLEIFRSPTLEDNDDNVDVVVRRSDVVVFLFVRTGEDLFMLGLAVGSRRPIVVVSPSPDLLPGNVLGSPYVRRSTDGRFDARDVLSRIADLRPTIAASVFVDVDLAELAVDPATAEFVSGSAFERAVVAHLEDRLGAAAIGLGAKGDGFDVSFTTDGGTVLVETKKGHAPCSVSIVRQLMGSLAETSASGGLLISSSGFTPAARELAVRNRILPLNVAEFLAVDLNSIPKSLRGSRHEIVTAEAPPERRVRSLSRAILVDLDGLDSIARQIKASAELVDSALAGLRHATAPERLWEGEAAARYVAAYERWTRAARDLADGLNSMASLVDQAANAYSQFDLESVQRFLG